MSVVEERSLFIGEWLKRREEMKTLCERFGISRKTGRKWVERFTNGGPAGLVDRSRRPQRIANAVDEDVAVAIVVLRERFPLWGPKKLRAYLLEHESSMTWPAASTMGELLKRRGLIGERRRRVRTPHATQPLSAATEPNVLWATDFKGCYRVAGRYCHPLTVSDGFSRFLVRVTAMDAERFEPVQQAFTVAFEEFGMPLRIRSDNALMIYREPQRAEPLAITPQQ